MSHSCICAVDPGLSGAVAFYYPDHHLIEVDDMPVADGDVDVASLALRIRYRCPDLAVVERVGAMPKQGVSSTFKFGTGYGMVRGVIAACKIPMVLVTPAKWKRHMNLSSDKEQGRAKALETWPGQAELFRLKKHHGRAEACLLALYAHKQGI